MSSRRIVALLLPLSSVGFVVGYIFTNSISFDLCIYDELVRDASCVNFYERIGDALYYSMGALAVVFALLLIFPIALRAWKLFAVWYIPIVMPTFLFYDGPGRGFMSIGPSPEQFFRWFAVIYIIISVAIIGTVVLRQKLGKRREPQPWSMKKKVIFWGAWTILAAVPLVYEIYTNVTGV